MLKYINTKTCRRAEILEQFGCDSSDPCLSDLPCCDYCCKDLSTTPEVEKPADFPLAEELRCSLSYYFRAENSVVSFSGLSEELIDTIVFNPLKYSDSSSLKIEFPFLKDLYVYNISLLIKAHLWENI